MPRKRKSRYRSGLEEEICNKLDAAGVQYEYEPRVLLYTIPASVRKYTPDVILNNGIIVEIKGRFTTHDRKKMALVTEQNPDLDIRMLFERNHTISKRSKTRYTDWCEKRGIKCALGREIPKEWIDERAEQGKDDG